MSVPAPRIITCREWGAKPPRGKIELAPGRAARIIEHHTSGNAGPLHGDLSYVQEATQYARDIQYDHQAVNGWIDSGHSYLVMRSGIILQGRWGTVTANEHGRTVISAHCPGQNDQPGIEHEHAGTQEWTENQWQATIALQAWLCDRLGIRPTELYAHRHFYATACPANLAQDIPELRAQVAARINHYGRGAPHWLADWRLNRAIARQISA